MKKIIKYQYSGGSNGPPFSKRVFEVEGNDESYVDIDNSQNNEHMNKDEKIINEIDEKENLLSDEFIINFIDNYTKRKEVLEKDFNKDDLIKQFLKHTEETMDLQNIEKNDENEEVIKELKEEKVEINEDIVDNQEQIQESDIVTTEETERFPLIVENLGAQSKEVMLDRIDDQEQIREYDFTPTEDVPEFPLIVVKQPEQSIDEKLTTIEFLQQKVKELEEQSKENNFNKVYQLEESIKDLERLKQSVANEQNTVENNVKKVEEEPKGFFKKLFYLFDFKTKREQTIFSIYMLPPVVISLISMVHVKTLFALVNNEILSWVLAASFELAALASLFSLKMLNKINSVLIWSLIFIIIGMQTAGNMYAAFAVINVQDGMIVKLLQLFGLGDDLWSIRVISFLLGGTLPVIAFLFIKSISEYLDNSEDEDIDY